jgi:hypothetical protein
MGRVYFERWDKYYRWDCFEWWDKYYRWDFRCYTADVSFAP